jgi:hypothetical protein
MYFQHDGAPHLFHVKLEIYVTILALGNGSDVWQSKQLASQASILKPNGLLHIGMDERNYLQWGWLTSTYRRAMSFVTFSPQGMCVYIQWTLES